MIARVWRTFQRLFGSPKLALVLLVFLGAWSAIATAIPQGEPGTEAVLQWAERQAAIEPVVDALGLHQAFAAPVFLAAVVLLAISTVVCSIGRTQAAVARTRLLSEAARADAGSLERKHDLVIDCTALSAEESLAIAAGTLERLGFRVRREGGVLRSLGPVWSVWGSPVFHWSLLALLTVVALGALVRSEGSMAIAVGGVKPDEPSSYVALKAGPWHNSGETARAIRIDDFDPAYVADGMVRGAVPTVSIIDEQGIALITKAVYPNSKLHLGSLSIHAPTCGLAVNLSILDENGTELTGVQQLVDFSQETSGGTVPVQPLMLTGKTGEVLLRIFATVPLDRTEDGTYGEWVPKQPSARVHLEDGAGIVLADGVVVLGEQIPVAGGGSIRLSDVGWYSRLVLVDDPTVPYVYATMLLALVGLTMSLVAPHRLVVAAIAEGEDGARLYVRLRLWRNNTASRAEIENALTKALSAPEGLYDAETKG